MVYQAQAFEKVSECSQIWSFHFYKKKNNKQSFLYIFLVYNTLYITSWKAHNVAMLWPQHFQLHGVTVSTTMVKIPEVLLHGVYMNSYEKSAPSKISFNCFNHTCVTHIRKTRLGGYFWSVISFQLVKVFSFFIFN